MKEVLWSEQARRDLRAIREFIAQDSTHYAQVQVTRIIERVDHIAVHPIKGHPVHEAPSSDLRETHSGNYRIIYRDDDEVLLIVTVVHMKQRMPIRRLRGR